MFINIQQSVFNSKAVPSHSLPLQNGVPDIHILIKIVLILSASKVFASFDV
jgi:hypothetical protein